MVIEKLTVKQKRHLTRLVRVLEKAKKDLSGLAFVAGENDTFPITTMKARNAVAQVLADTEARIFARRADAV